MLFQWQNHIKQAVSFVVEETCALAIEKSLPPMGGLEMFVANTSGQYAAKVADRLFDDSVAALQNLR
jgi:hypothetical protein